MNDDRLQKLLTQADERLGRRAVPASDQGHTAFVEVVRRRRVQHVRRCASFGVLAVLALAGGYSAWALRVAPVNNEKRAFKTIASNADLQTYGAERSKTSDGPGQGRRLSHDEIKRLQAEIVALDDEAIRARRMVALYRETEARRKRMAALEAAPDEPLLPPEALAELAIDRAAAITVTSADAQANQFNRPAEAAEAYRTVLALFPASRWAGVARECLEAMEQMN